jgi:predicted O-methyltransferase YrrM
MMTSLVKSFLLRFEIFRALQAVRARRRSRAGGLDFPIIPDYPFRSAPRYGYGQPPHGKLLEILDRSRQTYAATLQEFVAFSKELHQIPLDPPGDPEGPYWRNSYFGGLDAVSLYALAALNNPRTYIEIGSGNSTKFMRKVVRTRGLRTRMVSIDPNPRAEIDGLCDEVRRTRLEEIDLSVFDSLDTGDILFVDGSHRVFMNSDVSVIFLDILPRLKPGVLIYIDDIYLPLDYPPDWIPRYYSEQYLLAALLLAEGPHYEVVLPCMFVRLNPDLQHIVDRLWANSAFADAGLGWGTGFWLRRR